MKHRMRSTAAITILVLGWTTGEAMSVVGDDGPGGGTTYYRNLAVAPAALNATAIEGESPAPLSFQVWNSATTRPGTLHFSVSDTAPWIQCTPSSGSSSGTRRTISVQFQTADMTPGTYAARIDVRASSASPSLRTVAVQLTIGAAPTVTIAARSSRRTPTLTWACVPGARYTILCCQDLGEGAWTPIDEVTSTGTLSTWTDPMPDRPCGFFRIRAQGHRAPINGR